MAASPRGFAGSMTPTFEYPDDGRVTLTFAAQSEAFATQADAELWLKARGFSVGRQQAGAPRGVMFGDIWRIQKWRNLNSIEREALHGLMTGDGRCGPIQITIFASVPASVREAIVGSPKRSTINEWPVVDRAFDVLGQFAALGALFFVGAAIALALAEPAQTRLPGKVSLRAEPVITASSSTRAPSAGARR